ncbi:helix-turn-helix domain-containing protein [Sphingobacterium thalpophilum]|uniref:helix-turn-helix domain-containing protein n=1 Tax=Sphingobacterium thalpophilum TaxID=259 RepID=UPI003C774179
MTLMVKDFKKRFTKKNELSKAVSRRIHEILQLTKLSLQEFAAIAGINIRSLHGYFKGTTPITLESILKICTILAIDLTTFCDFNHELSDQVELSAISRAAEKERRKQAAALKKNNQSVAAQEKFEKSKKDRDQIRLIVHHTDYFLRPRTLFQMAIDFAREYGLCASPERIQVMLQRYVGDGLIKRHQTPWDYGVGVGRPKRTWVYFQDEEDLLANPEKLSGYHWFRNSVVA